MKSTLLNVTYEVGPCEPQEHETATWRKRMLQFMICHTYKWSTRFFFNSYRPQHLFYRNNNLKPDGRYWIRECKHHFDSRYPVFLHLIFCCDYNIGELWNVKSPFRTILPINLITAQNLITVTKSDSIPVLAIAIPGGALLIIFVIAAIVSGYRRQRRKGG